MKFEERKYGVSSQIVIQRGWDGIVINDYDESYVGVGLGCFKVGTVGFSSVIGERSSTEMILLIKINAY